MPKNFHLGEVAVNAEADAVAPLLDDGYLRIYDGVQPESADDEPGGSVLLVELRFGTPAFGPAVGGLIDLKEVMGAPALARGDASWFRALTADAVPAFDGSAGTDDADLLMPTTSIVKNIFIEVNSLTFAARK